MPWGIAYVPVPPKEQEAQRTRSARVRYVVQEVESLALLSGPSETVWRVRVRLDQSTSGQTFVLYVAQRPEAPAPYEVGGLVELDPRLLDRE